jgi:sugar phosphate isomerase/epimerase
MILVETLAPHLSNVLTSLDQTVALVKEINSPVIQTMFDTHNAVSEKLPHDRLIEKYAKYIHHVHINEMDGRRPGTGTYDFSVPLRALKKIGYQGWISLEVFKFRPSGEVVARESAKYIRAVEAKIEHRPERSGTA